MNKVITYRVDKLKALLLLLSIPLLNTVTYGQADKKFLRQGNREYGDGKYSDSEILYRKAADKNNTSHAPVFNIGDALYKQNKFEEAGKQFVENARMDDADEEKSAAFYNLGNSLLMADKPQESIEAYKNSLRINPGNPEAKYNLGYAQDLLKQQQQQQQQQDKNDQNKDQQDNKEQQDKNNQDDQNKDKKDEQDQDEEQKQDNSQNQQQQQGISKEDAERLLNAIANDEKNVQEKVKLAKAAKSKVRTLKNW